MFQAFYNSLSGLFGFSRSLETVSNNVSNMNTPGFRGSDSFFENVFGGRGTRVAGEGLRSQQGDIRSTGTSTDLAIDGSGYFVLQDDNGNLHYTRAGQFRFNEDGALVDSVTGYQVMAMDATGALVPINSTELRSLPAEATATANFSGNLAASATTHSIATVRVFDSLGEQHTLSVQFTNNSAVTANSWLVSVTNADGDVVGTGQLRFAADGTLLAGFTSIDVTLELPGGDQSISLSFGEAGSVAGTTQFAGTTSSLGVRAVDGHGVLGLSDLSFDADGIMQLTYSGGEEREGPRLALGFLNDVDSLDSAGSRMFSGVNRNDVEFGHPGDGVFGRVNGGSLELSNVNLTQEFADMIIIQRGYQANSRVLSVTNEMLENLYNSTRGG